MDRQDPGAGDTHRAALRRLAREVDALRAALEPLRAQLVSLLEIEQTRPQTAAEAGRVRRLRQEIERGYEELAALRDRFERLRRRT